MDTNSNICHNDCIVETNNSNTNTNIKTHFNDTNNNEYISLDIFNLLDENNLKNILSGNTKIKNKLSNLYLKDLEQGYINNIHSHTQSEELTNKYFKNFKHSTIFSLSVNFFRYILNIYNQQGSVCLVIYFLIMFWFIFIR